MQREHRASIRGHVDVAVGGAAGLHDLALERDHRIPLGGRKHLIVGAPEEMPADASGLGAGRGQVAKFSILEEDVDIGAVQGGIDAARFAGKGARALGRQALERPSQNGRQQPVPEALRKACLPSARQQ